MALAERVPANAWRQRLASGLAVVFAGLSAFLLWQLNDERVQLAGVDDTPSTHTAPHQRQFELTPVSSTSPANSSMHAVLTIRPGAATNLLQVNGLPQLSSGETYRLWAKTPQGEQGCMSFMPDAAGAVSIQVPSEPSGSATQVMITIDPTTPGHGPEQPGQAVLISA